jgi:hypothetical protein
MVFNATQQYFSYIVVINLIGGGNTNYIPTENHRRCFKNNSYNKNKN